MTDKSETHTDFDLAELLKGNVDSVVEHLPELSPEALKQLHDLEHNGDKRTTLLGPIDAEIKRRGDAEQGGAEQGGEGDGTGKGVQHDSAATDATQAGASATTDAKFTQADIDKAVGDALTAQGTTISISEHERLMAEAKTQHESTLAAKLAEAKGKAAPKPKPAPGAKLMQIDAKGDGPNLVALTGPTKVQFVDDNDMTLPHLPVLDFAPAQFEPAGDSVKLNTDVDFPVHLAGGEIAGAFLLGEDGKPAAKASLVVPIKVGGGKSVKLPKGTLLFERAVA